MNTVNNKKNIKLSINYFGDKGFIFKRNGVEYQKKQLDARGI